MLLIITAPIVAQNPAFTYQVAVQEALPAMQTQQNNLLALANTPPPQKTVPVVPFYSQFKDIQSPVWQKVGCGITSLGMLINYYAPGVVSVNTLLAQGIKAGAYQANAGWTYAGLIRVAEKYGLEGESYLLSGLSSANALAKLKEVLSEGPVIVSVHYKFDPKSTIPHLVVVNGIDNDTVYYNDPAAKEGQKKISVSDFLKAWKKRFIVVRPIAKAEA